MPEIDFSKVTQAKFIKLGSGGKWDKISFEDGTVRLGYYEVPSDYNQKRDQQKIFDIYFYLTGKRQTASNHARQVHDFYAAGPETIWVTFSGGRLWWCQAYQAVEFIGNDKAQYPHGSRLKRTVSGWHDCSISGRTLYSNDISGRLTKVAGFMGAICDIKNQSFDCFLRILQDQRHPEVEKIEITKRELLISIKTLIHQLTWSDFELLTDLIFSRSGWQRISTVGGQMKTIDLELIMPLTGERAVVQVKSDTTQQQLNDYIEQLQRMAADKAFYVYHTSRHQLECDFNETGIRLMGPDVFAEHILRAGLIDWLIEKIG